MGDPEQFEKIGAWPHGRHTPSLRRAHRFVGASNLTRLLEQSSCFGCGEGLGCTSWMPPPPAAASGIAEAALTSGISETSRKSC
jgi:hypothetical protein